MSAKYKSPSFLLPNELNTDTNPSLSADRASNYSMYFDGSSYISLGDDLPPFNQTTSKFSISFWLYNTAYPFEGNHCIFENRMPYPSGSTYDSGIVFESRASDRLFWLLMYPSANYNYVTFPQTELNQGEWNHIAIVFDGTESNYQDRIKIYVNNSPVTLSYPSSNVPTQIAGASAGDEFRIADGYQPNFIGQMDEFCVFSKSLTSTEVSALYNSGTPAGAATVLNLDASAYYPLGEQAQNTGYLDPSNPGSDISGSEWQFPNSVLQDYVMDFDGSEKINCGPAKAYDIVTLSAWVKPDSPSTYAGIFGTRNGSNVDFPYQLTNFAGKFRFIADGATAILSDNSFNSGVWYHVMGIADGTNLKMYVDGQLQNATASYSTPLPTPNNDLMIGAQWNTDTQYEWSGEISNVAIWNSNQTANVANIYNNGSPQTSYTVTPQNWWKLNADSVYTPSAPNYTTSLNFSGSGNRVNFNSIDLSSTGGYGNKTVSYWLKPSGAGLIVAGGAYTYYSYYNGSYIVIRDNSGTSSWPPLSLDNTKWHHFCVTGDGTNATLYVNGESKGSQPDRFPTVNTIGSYTTGSDGFFNGNVSNLAIYNVVLTASQVSTLFNFGTPETNISFSPQAWWKLDNTTTGIQDSSGNGNNGTNNGAANSPGGVAAVPSWKIPSALTIPTINYTSSLFIDESAQDRIDLNCTISGSTITGDGINLATTNTIAFWLYNSPTESSAGPILGGPHSTTSGNNFGALIYASGGGSTSGNYGSIGYWLTGQQAFGASAVAATQNGQWQHFAFVRNESTITLYIDGQTGPASDYQITLSIPANETIVYNIGEGINHSSGSWHADAYISNLQLFSTNLPATGSESIESLYNNGQPKDITGFSNIAAWYTLTDTATTSGGGLHDNGSSNFPANNSGASKIDGNVLVPSFNIPVNGVSTTLPSTALQQSDLQFDSPYSNYSLKFSTSQSIDTNFTLPASYTSYSYSFWYKSTAASIGTGDYYIISNFDSSNTNLSGTRGAVRFNNSTKMRIFGGDNTNYYLRQYEVGSSLLDQQWHNVVVTFTNTEVLLYIDGVSISAQTTTNTPITGFVANRSYTIGQSGINSGYLINSKLDEFAIFNKKLTEAEILSIYNNGKPNDISSLSPTNWWRLGENAYFVNNNITLPNSISGAPNGVSSGTATSMLSADAPGTYANGVGTNLDIVDRKGYAPLSTSNSQSYNMIPDDKVPYVPGYVGLQTTNTSEMSFDGIDDYFNLGNSDFTDTTYSLSLWFKSSDSGTMVLSEKIPAVGGVFAYRIYLYGSNGDLELLGSRTSGTAYNDGNWHHVVIVQDPSLSSGKSKGYVDGNLIEQNNTTGNTTGSNSFYIGCRNGSSFFFNGFIDEVAIWDSALTADQIQFDLYNATTTGKTADIANNPNLPTPVAWYRMGD